MSFSGVCRERPRFLIPDFDREVFFLSMEGYTMGLMRSGCVTTAEVVGRAIQVQ